MSKKLKLKKLQLNKETIAQLDDENQQTIKGGGLPFTITRGNCDFPTIGADDGCWCISAKYEWSKGIE